MSCSQCELRAAHALEQGRQAGVLRSRVYRLERLLNGLRRRLRDAEAGTNEHGLFWAAAGLVEALRWFYTEVEELNEQMG